MSLTLSKLILLTFFSSNSERLEYNFNNSLNIYLHINLHIKIHIVFIKYKKICRGKLLEETLARFILWF